MSLFTAPTAAPLHLEDTRVGTHSMTLSWDPPPFENRNGRIRAYHVQLREIETGSDSQYTINATEITVINLHPFYTYNCSVAAETVAIGPYSETLSIQLNEHSMSSFSTFLSPSIL